MEDEDNSLVEETTGTDGLPPGMGMEHDDGMRTMTLSRACTQAGCNRRASTAWDSH